MKIITLSGWGQAADALGAIAPQGVAIDYARYADSDLALQAIAQAGKGCEIAVGWSLGGQMLVRAITAGLLAPKRLVLIAVPFQFVAEDALKIGMGRDTFGQFRANYMRDAARTLRKAGELLCVGDDSPDTVRAYMNIQSRDQLLRYDWLYWLDQLAGFSCKAVDFSGFPPTTIVHGENDAVVSYEQARFFADHINGSVMIPVSGCGHAPHWHDASALERIIASAAYV